MGLCEGTVYWENVDDAVVARCRVNFSEASRRIKKAGAISQRLAPQFCHYGQYPFLPLFVPIHDVCTNLARRFAHGHRTIVCGRWRSVASPPQDLSLPGTGFDGVAAGIFDIKAQRTHSTRAALIIDALNLTLLQKLSAMGGGEPNSRMNAILNLPAAPKDTY